MTHRLWTTDAAERFVLPLIFGLLIAAVVLLVLGGPADILNRTFLSEANAGTEAQRTEAGLGEFATAIDAVRKPLNWAVGVLVPLGITAGGAMLAVGHRKGPQIIITSCCAGLAILLGNGVVA